MVVDKALKQGRGEGTLQSFKPNKHFNFKVRAEDKIFMVLSH